MTEQEYIRRAEALKEQLYRTAALYLGSPSDAVDAVSSLNKSIQKHNNLMDCQPYAKHRFQKNEAVFLYGFWTP